MSLLTTPLQCCSFCGLQKMSVFAPRDLPKQLGEVSNLAINLHFLLTYRVGYLYSPAEYPYWNYRYTGFTFKKWSHRPTFFFDKTLFDARTESRSRTFRSWSSTLLFSLADENASAGDRQGWQRLKETTFVDLGRGTVILIFRGEVEEMCHSFPLAARSPVLQTMLTVDMLERSSGRIRMPDMSAETGREFLYFLYTGHVRSTASVPVILVVLVWCFYSMVKDTCGTGIPLEQNWIQHFYKGRIWILTLKITHFLWNK